MTAVVDESPEPPGAGKTHAGAHREVRHLVDLAMKRAFDPDRPPRASAKPPRVKLASPTYDSYEEETDEPDSSAIMAAFEPAIQRFTRQAKALDGANHPFPCIWTDGDRRGPVPVDMDAFLAVLGVDAVLKLQSDLSMEALVKELQQAVKRLGLEPTQAPVDDVRHYFRTRLTDFIARNEAKVPGGKDSRHRSVPPAGNVGARLPFRVITETRGLRVHYSPAYFFDPTSVFGGPSSPVDGFLAPGRYIFGAYRSDGSAEFDRGEFDVPEAQEAWLAL
jgi:hypothetical protein